MKRIRGGAGLGDAMYIRPIAEHFRRAGEVVTVCCDYPGVFLGSGVNVEPFDRFNIDVLAHYVSGKRNQRTTQWQDICASAKIPEIPLRFDWQVRSPALVDGLKADAAGRPIILVHGGRTPMGRIDGFGKELLPERGAFIVALEALEDCFTVLVGKGPDLYPLPVSVDLNGSTSVSDLLDIGSICDGVVAQCSFAIPLAEVFDKPALFVWSSRGMQANMHYYIKAITPEKVLSKSTSHYVVDDWTAARIQETARSVFGRPMQVAA